MNKYIIAGIKMIFTFHNKDFFNTRLKEYEGDFLDSEADLVLHSSINNNIQDEEGEVIIDSMSAKCVLDKNGVYHYIQYKNKEKFICLKISYVKDYSKVYLEQIDHEHKYLTLAEREYMYSNQVFISRAIFLNMVMIHSSCIAYKDEAILFSANSGTGKSTHTGLWDKYYHDDVTFINDDKPLVKIEDGVCYAYGTPWSGKTDLNHNIKKPLKAFVVLERGEVNSIEKVELKDVIKTVFANIIVPIENKEIAALALKNYNDILKIVDIYRLRCTISKEAVEVVKKEVFDR